MDGCNQLLDGYDAALTEAELGTRISGSRGERTKKGGFGGRRSSISYGNTCSLKTQFKEIYYTE